MSGSDGGTTLNCLGKRLHDGAEGKIKWSGSSRVGQSSCLALAHLHLLLPAGSCLWLALNAEWMEAEAADSSYVTHAMHTSVLHGPDMTPPTATW